MLQLPASPAEPVIEGRAPLVILGMHRSATSCVAGVLHTAGVCLGERLLAADPTNPAGHFEDLEILDFHERVLRAHGLSATGFVGPCQVEPNAAFRAEAQSLVASRRRTGKPWGWKEPRTVLLLPFWKSVVPDGRFVAVFRPPWDVVDSLFRRGDHAFVHNPSLALTVWMTYNTAILDFARAHPADVIVREAAQVISQPTRLCADICDRFGVDLAPARSHVDAALIGAAPAEWRDFLRRAAPDCAQLLQDLRGLAGIPGDAGRPGSGGPVSAPDLDRGLGDWQRARHAAMLALRETARAEGRRGDRPSPGAGETKSDAVVTASGASHTYRLSAPTRSATDPLVVVGVPVFHGSSTVAETLRSIGQQTYDGFRVIISVDGDDEPSAAACRPFLDDPRFELHVQPQRLGWAGNVNWLMRRCLDIDEAAYFCFWQQDDLAATSYLLTLVAYAERYPQPACVVSDLQWFGARIDRVETPSLEGFALERVLQQIETGAYSPFLGLVRRAAIEAVGPVRITPHESALEDQVWLARLAAHGPWHRVPGTLYFKRAHRDATHWRWEHALDHGIRRDIWLEWGVGMLEAAVAATAPSDAGRLHDIVLDRLTVSRPGRWLFYNSAEYGAEAVEAFRGDFAARSHSRLGVVGAAAGELAEFRRRCASAGRCELITGLGEAGVATLGAGWCEPECGGVWSNGPLAVLHLPVSAGERWRVELRAQPYGTTDHDRLITLRTPAGVVARHVYLGGDAMGAVLECVLEGSGPLAIDMPWVTSPAALGFGDDHRRLGICLHHVSMTRRAAWSDSRVEPVNCTVFS